MKYLLGDWKESKTAFEKSIDLAQEVKSEFAEVLGFQRLATLETGLGLYDEAHKRLLDTLELCSHSDSIFVTVHSMTRIYGSLAQNRLEAGDLANATAYLAEGFAAQERFGECVTCDVLLYLAAVPIYIALGDLTLAERACSKIEETASGFGSRIWIAYARYLRGMMAAEAKDYNRSFQLLNESLGIFKGLGQAYDQARNLEYIAEVAEREDCDECDHNPIDLLNEAIAIYERLGSEANSSRVKIDLSKLS